MSPINSAIMGLILLWQFLWWWQWWSYSYLSPVEMGFGLSLAITKYLKQVDKWYLLFWTFNFCLGCIEDSKKNNEKPKNHDSALPVWYKLQLEYSCHLFMDLKGKFGAFQTTHFFSVMLLITNQNMQTLC